MGELDWGYIIPGLICLVASLCALCVGLVDEDRRNDHAE